MKNAQVKIFFSVIVLLVLGAIISFMMQAIKKPDVPGKYDAFATCIKDSGAEFFGAFWCSHCKNEKALFGSSAKLLPYVECSTPDGKDQVQICKDKKIEGYPTWIFANGERVFGEISLDTLAEKTSCVLPK